MRQLHQRFDKNVSIWLCGLRDVSTHVSNQRTYSFTHSVCAYDVRANRQSHSSADGTAKHTHTNCTTDHRCARGRELSVMCSWDWPMPTRDATILVFSVDVWHNNVPTRHGVMQRVSNGCANGCTFSLPNVSTDADTIGSSNCCTVCRSLVCSNNATHYAFAHTARSQRFMWFPTRSANRL